LSMQLPTSDRPGTEPLPRPAPESELTREQALVRLAVSDYVTLTKPRIISLLLIITVIPMYLAAPDGSPPGLLVLWTLLGGFLAAGGANTINQYFDRDIDQVMVRTRRRPLPAGRMTPLQVLLFGIGLSVGSFALIWATVNLLAALLAVAGIGYYLFIYTRLLKRHSTQNIVIGGAAGAIPPLVGWAAVTNDLSLLPILLFLIVFYWTPPHFWALALLRQKEYAAAGVPMLPVIVGERETHNQIVLYSVLMALVAFIPSFLGLLGPVYLALAIALKNVFLWQAVAIRLAPTNANIWRLYKFSLLHLALLFFAMGVDRLFYNGLDRAGDFVLRLPW
jgi:heme o synthase